MKAKKPHHKSSSHKLTYPKVEPVEKPDLGVEFSSKEFVYHEKNSFWYVGIVILLVGLLLLTLNYQEYLMAAVVVALGIAIFRLAHQQPSSKSIRVNERGVYWGDDFIAYHQIKAFWLTERTGQANVYLERPNFATQVHFPVPDAKIDEVMGYLMTYLPFHHHKDEPVSDRFARLLKL